MRRAGRLRKSRPAMRRLNESEACVGHGQLIEIAEEPLNAGIHGDWSAWKCTGGQIHQTRDVRQCTRRARQLKRFQWCLARTAAFEYRQQEIQQNERLPGRDAIRSDASLRSEVKKISGLVDRLGSSGQYEW